MRLPTSRRKRLFPYTVTIKIAQPPLASLHPRKSALYFAPFGMAVVPPAFAQVPLATYFHSVGSMSFLAWPAHEWVPITLAQSF